LEKLSIYSLAAIKPFDGLVAGLVSDAESFTTI